MRAGTPPLRVVPKEVAVIMCITSAIGMLIGLSLLSSLSVLFAARYWLTGLEGPYKGDIPSSIYVLAVLEALYSIFCQWLAFNSYPAFNYRSVAGGLVSYVAEANGGLTDVPATVTFRSAENWCAGWSFMPYGPDSGVTIESSGSNVACPNGRFTDPFEPYNAFYEWIHTVGALAVVISLGNCGWVYYSAWCFQRQEEDSESRPLLAAS